jgi:hypothetical protein
MVFEVLQGLQDLDQMLEMMFPLPNLDGHRRYPYDLIHDEESPELNCPSTVEERHNSSSKNSDLSVVSPSLASSPASTPLKSSSMRHAYLVLEHLKKQAALGTLSAIRKGKSSRSFRKKDRSAKVFVLK